MDALSRRWLCVLAAILAVLANRQAFVPIASRLGALGSLLGSQAEKGINPGPSKLWTPSTGCPQMLCLTTGFLISASLVARHLQVSPKRIPASSIRKASTKLNAASGDSIPAGKSIKLFSPAKVNLFLRIIRRRPDGYHDLASLFHTVAFGDTLDLEVLPTSATKDELECNLPGVPVDDSNLVIRALKLFRSKSGIDRFFKLRLQKQIPAQAGMGGGSSNAASAFFGANLLCGSPATEQDLMQWGDDPIIGSDATFFLSHGAAYCTGRGEIVTPVAPLPIPADKSIYLVKPKYGLSTPSAFKALKLDNLSTVSPEELLQNFQDKGTSHSKWVNDLEPPAFQVAPNLGELKQYLSSSDLGFEAVLMSGSGSTIYCVGEPLGGADAFKAATKERFEIEGIWRTTLIRRKPGEWYSEAA
jgi:4-diphosphocytidyl-2-C-methyl-D-erythritol kinase